MNDYNISSIDILKIDIEGAEKEVFSNASKWIDNVNVVIVELHENLKPGCTQTFYNNTDCFDHEWMIGEKICLSRGNYFIPEQ